MNSTTTAPGVRRMPLFALFAANVISMVGNVLSLIAIPWFVFETTGSAAKTGITGFFTVLPTVIAAFFGGAIVDRLGYKRASIVADLASAVTVAMIPLLYTTIGLEFWQLLVLVFLGSLLDAPGSTARAALVPELARDAGMSLERASSASQVVERTSRMVGAPLAGLLIALVGANAVLWIDALSFVVSAGLIALALPKAQPVRHTEQSSGYFADLRAGYAWVRRDPLILAIILVVMITNFLDAPLVGVIYPIYTKEFYGSALYLGTMVAVGGAGAVIGALIYGAIGHRLSRRLVFYGGFLIAGLRFVVLALVPPFWAIIASGLIAGVAAGPLNPIISTISYERIPENMRGRVFGMITAGAWVAMPLGSLLAGFLLEHVDVRAMLVGIGLCYVGSVAALSLHPATRAMDAAREHAAALQNAEGSA